jgi:hypothetical protein
MLSGGPVPEKLEPLNQDDIEIALQQIEDDYPLARKPLHEVLPIFAICCGRKSSEKEKLIASSTDAKMEAEIKETDQRLDKIIKENNGKKYQGSSYIDAEIENLNPAEEEEGQDIFDTYGFGITSWFDLLRLLIKLYFVFALVGMGLMYFYSTHGTELSGSGMAKSAKFTLGNLGFSKSKCDIIYIDAGTEHTIECSKGVIQPLLFKGIMPNELD